jgi:hypothetical protein
MGGFIPAVQTKISLEPVIRHDTYPLVQFQLSWDVPWERDTIPLLSSVDNG